jgi:hypothetical protein
MTTNISLRNESAHGRIPVWVKLAYTGFILVLCPSFYRTYGASNFLWLCDLALLVTWVGLWLESPLLIGMQAVSVIVPQLIWLVLFAWRGITGTSELGLLDNMFDSRIPVFVRGLSLFHGWMPLLLLWMLARLGYDRRAVWVQSVAVMLVFVATFVLLSEAAGAAGNVNFVLGSAAGQAPSVVSGWFWVALLCVAYPLVICLNTHLLLRRLFDPPGRQQRLE